MNIFELHQRFCDERLCYNFRPQTIKWYKGVFKFFTKETQVTEINEVTEQIVKTFFFNGRSERGWSSTTFINYRKALIVFFKWCVENGIIQDNPFNCLKKPKTGKRLPKNLCVEDAFRILEFCQNYPYPYHTKFLRTRNYAIMATFLYSGLRKSEVVNLKLADIDLDNNLIFIRSGKGDKDRTIPIPFDLARILRDYLIERRKKNKKCYNFFTSSYRDMGFGESGLKHLILWLKKETKINFHLHMLRHCKHPNERMTFCCVRPSTL